MSQRIQKINELLRHEVSQLLLKEIDFDGILVTIISVDTAPNLSQAKIKITTIPTQRSERALRFINKDIYQIQQQLNKRLNLKFVPKLIFEIDKLEEKAQRIEKILTNPKS
ncbi:MAG: ribosome-binding factor A [Parcubacteria group bacterium]|jgi:ribosome-binding factor A|nr:ribosome-binding factor A [Parcubacteria group bacterium]|tara:strand:- start:1958 stop:2290 length:333 start_codon:yes stop_codon:yes gene_type:complete